MVRAGETAVERSLHRGLRALRDLRRNGAAWSDFRTAAGESDEWVTAFVCAYLEHVPGSDPLRAPALAWLASRQRPDGGWGYGKTVASDCDSTAWALHALRGALAPERAEAACRLLLEHQAPEGGFSTYRPSLRPRRPSLRPDWFAPQPCVTARAVVALRDLHPEAALRGAEHLIRIQPVRWTSCWWAASSYTLCHALEAVSPSGNEGTLGAAVEVLRGRADGESAFERAHTLLARAAAGALDCDGAGALEALRSAQREDGTWEGAPVLRVPDDRPGVAIVASDQNGTFATVSALRAMAALARRSARP